MDTPLIEFKDVTKRFGQRTILEHVNLQIYEGQVTTIIGLSGSGKSLLLKHIIGLIKPDEGAIFFRGNPINKMKKSEMAASLAQISYMFQDNALFDSLTVYDNIALPLRETTNLGKTEINSRVMARIEQTELSDAAQKYPSELSGGMQKRAALARALVTDPRIVLFDEPTSGQDPVRKNAILSMIAQYQRKFGFTAILVSHEIPDVYFISNRILALYDRSIVFQGTPEELENFSHPFKNEVIDSLEGLQEELTGLYSKRQFKVLNHGQLKRRTLGETYSVVVFTLGDLPAIIANLGYDAAQGEIRRMGIYIEKHFSAIGGFSTRLQANEFVTVLPYSDLAEAESILKDFIQDFQGEGIKEIGAGAHGRAVAGVSIECAILAGIAQGQPIAKIDAVIESARQQQKEIARLRCDGEVKDAKVYHGNNRRHLSRDRSASNRLHDDQPRSRFSAG